MKRAAEEVAENLVAILTYVSMVMERLPAVDTDQNASVTGGATVSPVDAMTPLEALQLLAELKKKTE